MCGHSERVATGGVQSCQLTVSQVPKVTFSENTVLLSLQRREKDAQVIRQYEVRYDGNSVGERMIKSMTG